MKLRKVGDGDGDGDGGEDRRIDEVGLRAWRASQSSIDRCFQPRRAPREPRLS